MKKTVITNNPRVSRELAGQQNTDIEVEIYPEAAQLEILYRARDYIHLGAELIVHPMMGRIKPHETPYKSVFLRKLQGETHFESLLIIEDSIAETKKLLENTMQLKYDDRLLLDLSYLDWLLLKNGIDEERGR